MDTQPLGPAPLLCPDSLEQSYPQPFPAFAPESYYSPHNALGEAPPPLHKPTNPRLYVGRHGYELQSYITPPTYATPPDLCDPRMMTPVLGGASSSAPLSTSSSSATYDPQAKAAAPASWNHCYHGDYPCRFPGNGPGSPAALQTIITTTTKVSYQPCPKPALSPFASCVPPPKPGLGSLLDESGAGPSYSTEVKLSDESGVIKSLSFPADSTPAAKTERDGYDYRYGNGYGYRYDEY